jgi:hypothetical protein
MIAVIWSSWWLITTVCCFQWINQATCTYCIMNKRNRSDKLFRSLVENMQWDFMLEWQTSLQNRCISIVIFTVCTYTALSLDIRWEQRIGYPIHAPSVCLYGMMEWRMLCGFGFRVTGWTSVPPYVYQTVFIDRTGMFTGLLLSTRLRKHHTGASWHKGRTYPALFQSVAVINLISETCMYQTSWQLHPRNVPLWTFNFTNCGYI